ncbi:MULTISPECIES: hypothetical protein [unclassified Nocardia]|uniref:hypothetical protein n=1 Tax=unclassified Nocardia TaxID=2637762 RepID=UPI0033B75345
MTRALPSGIGLMPVRRPDDHRPRLDRLSTVPITDLARRFSAATPTSAQDLDRLDGDLMLRGFAPVGTGVLQRILSRPSFFWMGKSFRRVDDELIAGHNFFTALGGSRGLPFAATIGPSVVDGRPAVRIDYGDPRLAGTWLTRRLYDELREIEPGLWLGPGFLRIGQRRVTACWFAVDSSVGYGEVR